MLTEKDYCDKDLSLALKEVGYIGQGTCYYDLEKEPNKLRHLGIQVITTRTAERLNYVLAVHLYEAQKWLREEKKLFVEITIFEYTYGYRILDSQDVYYDNEHVVRREGHLVGSYEEALSEGIKEAVKILKDGIRK